MGAAVLICSSAPAQNLFISSYDGQTGFIYEYTPQGVRTTFASGLMGPDALAFDSAGNLFVADIAQVASSTSGSIYKFTPDGVRSTFVLGLSYPTGLAFDSAGDLFVADSSVIYKFKPTGARTTFAFAATSGLVGLAFGRAGNLFVGSWGPGANDSAKIYKFTPGGVRTTFASGFFDPFALAFDSAGNLFVAEGGGSVYDWPFLEAAVYKFTPSGVRSTVASQNDQLPVLPNGLAIDSADNLFVADRASRSILKFTPSGARTTFASGVSGPLAFQPARTAPTPTPTATPRPTPTPTPTPTPAMPAVSLSASPRSVNKGGTATFTATASTSDSFDAMVVNFSTGGNAGYGSDYTLSANQITIPAGQSTGSVTLQVITTKTNGKEKATMTLQPGTDYTVVTEKKANVTIHNK